MNAELRTQAHDLKGFLTKHMDAIKAVSASVLTPERMVRLVCAAANRQPDLALCTPLSILNSMMQAATYDLGVCDGSNEGYLVSYNCKVKDIGGKERWEKQAQFIPGYQGLVKKAVESGKVTNIDAHVVYENDSFEYEYGQNPSLVHKPTLKAKGEPLAAYAIAYFPNGKFQFEVMTIEDINKIKARSKSKNSAGQLVGPWVTDEGEMQRKTVVRKLYKYIPKSKAMAALLELQAKAEAGDFLDGELLRPGDAESSTAPIKIINEDGDAVYHWTDEDREEAKAVLGTHMDSLLDADVSDESRDAIDAEYKILIGHPDISFHVWHNRLDGKVQRTIDKVKDAQ